MREPIPRMESAGARIRQEVLRWPGVTEAPHRFGGVELLLGKRELGHLHGDVLADLPFPVRVREELVRAGRAVPHHVLPESGWVSYHIQGEEGIAGALALFRQAYDRAVTDRGLPDAPEAAASIGGETGSKRGISLSDDLPSGGQNK